MGKLTILAIDDNAVNLAAIEQALGEQYEVVPMINGKRAIKYLSCKRADLILLDVKMPIMDGIETLKEIRNLGNGVTVPVLFLTAADDKDIAEEGFKLGIIDYIRKPFDGENLKRRIEKVLIG